MPEAIHPQVALLTTALNNLLKTFKSRENLQKAIERILIEEASKLQPFTKEELKTITIHSSIEGNCIICNKPTKCLQFMEATSAKNPKRKGIGIYCLCEQHGKKHGDTELVTEELYKKIFEVYQYIKENPETTEYVLGDTAIKSNSENEEEYNSLIFSMLINFIAQKEHFSQEKAFEMAKICGCTDIQSHSEKTGQEACLLCDEKPRAIAICENESAKHNPKERYVSYKLCKKHFKILLSEDMEKLEELNEQTQKKIQEISENMTESYPLRA